MFSKLLCKKPLQVSYGMLTKLRPWSQFAVCHRNLSILHRNKQINLAACSRLNFQNSSTTSNLNLFMRNQSTHSEKNVVNATSNTDAANTISEKSASTTASSNEILKSEVSGEGQTQWISDSIDAVGSIPDPPIPVEIVHALSANGEPTLASLGLCNYTPVGLVQYCLEFLHVSFDLPWWAAIAVATVTIRLLMFPVVIKTQRLSASAAVHMPKVQYYTQKMTEARKAGDLYEASLYGNELMRYVKATSFNPMKSMAMPFIQAPVFLSMFWGLNKMSSVVETMKHGGTLWFTDLSVYDPYYILPVITSASLFATIEIGTDSTSAKHMTPTLKLFMRVMPIIIFPITMHFSSAVFIYWVTNNIVSVVQVSLLRLPKVRTYFGIPLKKQLDDIPQLPKKGFKQGFKETLNNFKIARDLRERENFNEVQFRRAGKGPLVKTYDYNPKQTSNSRTAVLAKKREV